MYLTRQQYAVLHKISVATVDRRLQDGTIPGHQPAGKGTAVRIWEDQKEEKKK